ncbi:MAG TPA: DsrE family protein [Candidatus Binatia bacterium]|nr:DsrE family protein [Candidatus Binatia bacterium]
MKYLFIFNDSPYGDQRAYNGLRLAAALSRKAATRVFLLGDGVLCGLAGFTPAHADYNPQELLRASSAAGAAIAACGTCMEARGIPPESLIPEVRRSSLDELAAWTEDCDKVVTF